MRLPVDWNGENCEAGTDSRGLRELDDDHLNNRVPQRPEYGGRMVEWLRRTQLARRLLDRVLACVAPAYRYAA